jgi:cytochrome c5
VVNNSFLQLNTKTIMKKLKVILPILMGIIFTFSYCGDSGKPDNKAKPAASGQGDAQDPTAYDPKRGEGKYTSENLNLSPKLDPAKAEQGEKLAEVKCTSCHKMTDEKLVGPGWKGVTLRRTPEWIMNFITDPGPMIDKDPEAQAMLEICLVRMPNQNLSGDEAKALLEYMRKIDGVN